MAAPNKGHILAVDDEQSLLSLITRYLTMTGYSVEACTNAEQAIEKLTEKPNGFSALVTDLSLPGMPGEEMLEKMFALQPNLRVVVCSGYPFEPAGEAAVHRDQIASLQKPFLARELGDVLDQLLKG